LKNRILIVGAGAMACLYAAQLSRAGVEVTMLDRWRTGVEALNHSGVQVVDPSGTVSATRYAPIQTPPEWRKRNWRWCWSNPGKPGTSLPG
jgi:ketopantoate reductase